MDAFVEALNLGGDGYISSAYSQYRIWLATLSHHCGWKVENETLRIPSTRNWALVGESTHILLHVVHSNDGMPGRSHLWHTEDDVQPFRQNVLNIIGQVRDRGIFKTRTPEGKAGDH